MNPNDKTATPRQTTELAPAMSSTEPTPRMSVADLMRHAIKRISIRLVAEHFRDHALVVTEPSSTEDMEA
jgi:hypothetical protein